jgi:hypothetical protein
MQILNQDAVVEALGKHLDALQTVFNSIILLAVAIAWAGISHQSEIQALSIKFKRRDAFFVASGLYLIANVVVLILFRRIGDLFVLLDNSHTASGFSTIAIHSWILNPFSYFGSSIVARLCSGGGIGLLCFTWYLCNASLYTLDDKLHPSAAKIIMGSFSALGVLSLMAIVSDHQIIIRQVGFHSAIGDQFRITMIERMGGTLAGIGGGALTFKAIRRLSERWSGAS